MDFENFIKSTIEKENKVQRLALNDGKIYESKLKKEIVKLNKEVKEQELKNGNYKYADNSFLENLEKAFRGNN